MEEEQKGSGHQPRSNHTASEPRLHCSAPLVLTHKGSSLQVPVPQTVDQRGGGKEPRAVRREAWS